MSDTKIDRAFQRFAATGHPDALAYVFDRTAAELFRLAGHLAGDEGVAEDLVQSTFLIAIEKRQACPADVGVLPWLCGILTNRARERRRTDSRRIDAQRLNRKEVANPADLAEAAELSEAMIAVLAELPAVYRPVMDLYLCHGLTAVEIAKTLARPPGTVRTQLVRGLELIRSALPVGLVGSAVGLVFSPQAAAQMRERLTAMVPGAALASPVGLKLGASWLGKKLALASALLVVAAGLYVGSETFGGTEEDLDQNPVTTPRFALEESDVAEPRTRLASTTEIRQRDEVAAELAVNSRMVRGRCVQAEDRRPLAGVRVTLAWMDKNANSLGKAETHTLGDGTFAENPPLGAQRFRLDCSVLARIIHENSKPVRQNRSLARKTTEESGDGVFPRSEAKPP